MLFDNDAAVITPTDLDEARQSLINCFTSACKEISLIISTKDTNVIWTLTIITDDDILEVVEVVGQVNYLGSTIANMHSYNVQQQQ